MVFTGQIDHPAAWKGSDFTSKDAFCFDLQSRHLTAFRSLIGRLRDEGMDEQQWGAEQLAMHEIASDLAAIRNELINGRGLVVIRGFPCDELPESELILVFRAVGAAFGQAVSQSPLGDRIGVVSEKPKPDKSERAYRTSQRLNLHTDSDEIVGLLCIRNAKSGGFTRLASAAAIHNEIAVRYGKLLEPLYEGFPYHWMGTQSLGEPPITPYRVPVFSHVDEHLSACYIRELIHEAASQPDNMLSRLQQKALTAFDLTADRPDVVLKFMLEPGEASFINNYAVLHSRTGFSDFEEEHRKRRLLRLWLKTSPGRPVHPNMRRYCNDRPGARL